MKRRWWRLSLWLSAALLLAVIATPFTRVGSRAVLTVADHLLPLEIRYDSGVLAGQLKFARLSWVGEAVRLDLLDVVAELELSCLWHSKICFRQLQARQLDIVLKPGSDVDINGPATALNADIDAELVVFPVPIEADAVQLDAARIQWEHGQWEQGIMRAAVRLAGSTVQVGPAMVANARLSLLDAAPDASPGSQAIALPGIDLPLELKVEDLQLLQPAWDIYGAQRQLQSLALRGSWRNRALRLERLEVKAEGLGELYLQGGLDFGGHWPLQLEANVVPALQISGWPALLQRQAAVNAEGDLAALKLQVAVRGAGGAGGVDKLAATAQVNVLNRELPFSLSLRADWEQPLAVDGIIPQKLKPLPAALAGLTLGTPLLVAASGSLGEQVFQLDASASGLGYQGMALHLAGRRQGNTLTVEDMRLQEAGGANTLWGTGTASFGDSLQWALALESSGFDLPELSRAMLTRLPGGLEGRLQGQLQASGSQAGRDWQLELAAVKLTGTVNKLPARLTGYGGINQDLLLAPSDLQAELNGAKLSLQGPGTATAAARFNVSVPELERWYSDIHGRLSLQGEVAVDWQRLQLSGLLERFHWGDLAIKRGDIKAAYRAGKAQASRLELSLSELTVAGIDLSSLDLEADGNGGAQTLTLQSRGDLEGDLQLHGALGNGSDWAGTLAPTTLQTPQGQWRLEEPTAVDWTAASAQLRVARHCWRSSQTQICTGDSLLGKQGAVSLDLTGGIGLLAGLLPEGVDVAGDLQSSLVASWSPAAPFSLDASLQARQLLVTRQLGAGESASVSWDEVDAALTQGASGLQLTAAVQQSGREVITLNGQLPATREAPLQGTLGFAGMQLSTLAPFTPDLETLEGELTGQLQLQGTVDQPLALGSVKLTAGRAALLGNPTELQQLELNIEARGDRAEISGKGRLGGGELNIAGELRTSPEMHLKLALDGNRNELLVPPSAQILVSEKLALSVTAGLLDLSGSITVHEGVLQQEQLPEGSVDLSADVVEVDYSGNVISETRAFDTSMNILLSIENNFRIVGENVNATVGGDLQLLQAANQPLQLFGNLNVIGGELRAYQQRLRIERGTISFSGSPENPEFDVRAQREISSERIIAGVQLQGTLAQPQLDVYSDPAMSEGEAMSYLVRGRGLDTGANADGLALALSLGTGIVNQSALVTELNRIPGISNLAFSSEGADGDTAATVGGYIGDRLYLSYGVGLYEPISVMTARLYLKTRLWLEVVSRLESSVDLYYSFDID